NKRGVADAAGLGHLLDEVVALTGALADPGEHRHTTVVLGDTGDHLLDQHGLADAGTTEQADLAALHVGGEQVDDLDAGLEHLGLGLELVEGGGLAVDAPPLLDVVLLALLEVEDVTGRVEHVALGDVTDRDGDRLTGVDDAGAADEAVGRLHRDGADHAVTDVQRDLEDQRLGLAGELQLHLELVVHLGHRVRGELDVHHGAGHPGDAAGAPGARALLGLFNSGSHISHSFPALASASAFTPPTISLISWVMPAWRAWLAMRVYFLISSSALSVADFMAF